jgi:hypothetical protein
MMSKGSGGLKIVISLVVLIAMIHASVHVIIFNTNISLAKTIGLSGLAIGETNIGVNV